MTFGERLYRLRSEKNLSQEQLAELLDVSRQSISKWENDKAYPEMTRLLFLSDYFQVSLDYLMRGTEEKSAVADLAILDKRINERAAEGWELVTYDYMATSMQIKGAFVITFRKEK